MSVAATSRRGFLAGSAGLVLSVSFGGQIARAAAAALDFVPNAFVRVDHDGTVSVISPYLEMGQGVFTGIATLVAEEMDADWSKVRVEPAPSGHKDYINPAFASTGWAIQGTGGSSSLRGAWDVMRKAGAVARAMLVSAAARSLGVPESSLAVRNGVVIHASSGRQLAFGDLVAVAASLRVPTDVPMKAPRDYTLVGRSATLPRVDVPSKVNGTAVYTQDIKLPDMLVAVVAHPPRWGATVRHVDDSAARSIPGVLAVIEVPGDAEVMGGVAVLARNTWVARQGRDALNIVWDDSKSFDQGSEELFAQYRALSQQPGIPAVSRGTILTEVPAGGHVIDASFAQPYLCHASMEPLNCLVKLGDGICEIWNGEQFQSVDQQNVAKELGLKPEQIVIHQLYAGGSFGRRANPRSDYVREAVRIAVAAKAHGIVKPIKMVWMREDDMRGGQYRPMTQHRGRLVLDAHGRILSWYHVVVGQSFTPTAPGKIDNSLSEGLSDLPYDVPNLRVEQHVVSSVAVPTQWLRSVGHTHTAFVGEGLIDEAARTTGQDPYHFRRGMLSGSPRHLGVLDAVARAYSWERPLAPGRAGELRGRGIAVWQSFGTYLAQVAEVTVHQDGSFSVDRVVCAVDCGRVVNPDIVRSQIEGGVGFGLSFLGQEITLKEGRVEQGNFNDYPVLRMNRMPVTEVHIVQSDKPPSGVGEPGVPPIVPAVGNAIAAATGRPVRSLPIGNLAPRAV